MLKDKKDKQVVEFAKLITKLNAAQIVGLTRLLKVNVFYNDVKDEKGKPMPRSGEAIIEDCLVKFYAMNRKERRDIIKLVRAAGSK